MVRALVVGTSASTSVAVTRRGKKPATPSAPSSSTSAGTARPRAAAKRKAPSSSTASTSGAGPSSAPKKRARKTTAPAAGPSSPPAAKASRKRAAQPKPKKETPEKRLARYIATPSAATSERITRAYQHRLYLIDKKLVPDPNSATACLFNILGSTGNVYEVKLQQRPSCTCPDFPRSGLCKHVLFVMLRVLKLDRHDPRVWQKALLDSELKELLEISATTDGVLASQSVRERFQELQQKSGKVEGEPVAAPVKTVQRDITGDCPICYEQMDDGKGKAKEPVVFCRVCGNNVHKDCFDKWTRSKSASGEQTTCIYCRAVWDENEPKKAKFSTSDYVNLADVSEVHWTQPASLEELYPESHRWIGFHGRRGRGRGR